jgi:hypothetical protein
MRKSFAAGAAAMTIVALLAGAAPARAADKGCDRACLEGLVGKYLTALAAHDPGKAPASRDFRFVENDQVLKPGQGTWTSVTALGGYRHVFADPESGAAAVITTVTEAGKPAILDLAIKVQNRRIVEAESQIIRDAGGAARYEGLKAPAAEWLAPTPPAERLPREQLIAATNRYFTGMQRNDPKGDYSFFDPDCNRLEHATQTTNLKTPEAYGHSNDTDFSSMTCQQQFQTGFLGFVTEIRDRRFMVVDEERQAVFAFADLDHNGTVRLIHQSTGKDFPIPAYFDVPRTLQVGEAFRIRGAGKLWRIEMTLTELPYGMRPASATAPAPQTVPPMLPKGATPGCDRDCLGDLLGRVLQAMVDHRPGDAPLAPTARYTENGQVLKPGDGIWGTASAIAMPGDGLASLGPKMSAYKLFFADPNTGQAGCLCATNENGTPGMMAVRIEAIAGKISEIEAVIVREEGPGSRGGTVALFKTPQIAEFDPKGFTAPDAVLKAPLAKGTTRADMGVDIRRYLDAVAYNHRSPTPAALEGSTRLNGRALQGLIPPAAVRSRRFWLVDEETGLAVSLAVLDHGTETPPGVARSNLLAMVMKIDGGQIRQVEALERPVPYGMHTGWTEWNEH